MVLFFVRLNLCPILFVDKKWADQNFNKTKFWAMKISMLTVWALDTIIYKYITHKCIVHIMCINRGGKMVNHVFQCSDTRHIQQMRNHRIIRLDGNFAWINWTGNFVLLCYQIYKIKTAVAFQNSIIATYGFYKNFILLQSNYCCVD